MDSQWGILYSHRDFQYFDDDDYPDDNDDDGNDDDDHNPDNNDDDNDDDDNDDDDKEDIGDYDEANDDDIDDKDNDDDNEAVDGEHNLGEERSLWRFMILMSAVKSLMIILAVKLGVSTVQLMKVENCEQIDQQIDHAHHQIISYDLCNLCRWKMVSRMANRLIIIQMAFKT